MEQENYRFKYRYNQEWHDEWVTLCKNRVDFSKRFLEEQENHFKVFLDTIRHDKPIVKYQTVHKYIADLYDAAFERTDESLFRTEIKLIKWNELNRMFFQFYYDEFLDDDSQKIIEPFFKPKKYNKRYDLIFSFQFLEKPYPVVEKPSISIYDIDKAIILQMDTYEGGEKLAFLEYQFSIVEDKKKRLRSWSAYLEDLENDFSKPSSYKLGLEFVNEKIREYSHFDNPIRTNLSQIQIGIFYRLLQQSGFTNDEYNRIFEVLSITHTSNRNNYPTIETLKQSSRVKVSDLGRIRTIIKSMEKKLKTFPTLKP